MKLKFTLPILALACLIGAFYYLDLSPKLDNYSGGYSLQVSSKNFDEDSGYELGDSTGTGSSTKPLEYYRLREKQLEAKKYLGYVGISLKLHYAEWQEYSETAVEKGLEKYSKEISESPYSIHIKHKSCKDCGVKKNSFMIIAVGNIDEDETNDIWVMDDANKFTNIINDIEE